MLHGERSRSWPGRRGRGRGGYRGVKKQIFHHEGTILGTAGTVKKRKKQNLLAKDRDR